MSASVARVGRALRLEPRLAGAFIAAFLLAVAVAAALATRQGMLPIAVAAPAAVAATIIGLRWPLALLLVFAALIPIEEVAVVDGFGTLSRGVGILFVLTYAASRLTRLNLAVIPLAGWAYLAWAIASLAWARGPDAATAQLTTLVQLFVIAVFTADFVVQRPSIVRPVFWAYSISAAATAAIGVAAYLAQHVGTTRSAAIQDQDPAQFAAVLVPAVIFGLYETINGPRRSLGAAIAILASAGVVVSGTRGAWVACVVVILFVVLPQLNARRRAIALVAIAAIAVAALQVPGVGELVADRSENAVSTGGAGRTDIWSVGLTIFETSPVTGVGYANFPVAFTTQMIRDAGVGWARLTETGRGSHNVIVANAVELGVVGLVLLAAFLGPLLVRRGWGPDAATVQAALIGLMTTALFLDILANRKQVWLVIALAAGLAYVARSERARHAGMAGQTATDDPAVAPSLPGGGSASPLEE